MDWFAAIDGYCERIDHSYWAEPVNALTNLAFLLAALFMVRRLRGARLPLANAMVVLLGLIGIGSYLFHTHAQTWSALTDVGFILLFILLYQFAASRDYLGLSAMWSAGTVVVFVPIAVFLAQLFQGLPILGRSASYLPVFVLIALYSLLLRKRSPETARALMIGALILLISITLRSLDIPLCNAFPLGTHFMWHLLNAAMLAWMIETYRRHMLAPPRSGR